jgi:hypothetical protein
MPTTALQDMDATVLQDKLKSALWFHIGKIVDEETLKLGVNATPHFIGNLVELVWTQIGKDSSLRLLLEAFCDQYGWADSHRIGGNRPRVLRRPRESKYNQDGRCVVVGEEK